MPDHPTKLSSFKPYLLQANVYKGGKTLQEIGKDPKKIYKMSSNENPIGSSPKAIQAIRESVDNLHHYPDRTPIRLQMALQSYYSERLSGDQFLVANSGSELLELTIRAFVDEGHECIISSPCFSPYKMFVNWQGGKIIDVPLQSPDFRLDTQGILEAINERTRLVFITSPNNPTGSYATKKELDEVIYNLPEHVVAVLDEVYYLFADAGDYTSAIPYVQEGKNVIAVNSFSKSHGLAALRIGYAYSTPTIAGYIRQLCKPFIVNKLTLNAGMAALEDQDFVSQTVKLVQQQKVSLYAAFDELPLQYWKNPG